MQRGSHRGFTLIELSIVLVIIGLIVGGVLAGQELIRAASVRATITQVERFNSATNTFRGKYGYLPGDITGTAATSFGFAARGSYAGEGDGSGIIEGVDSNVAAKNDGVNVLAGETAMFWVDLSKVNMIEGTFTSASPTTLPGSDPKARWSISIFRRQRWAKAITSLSGAVDGKAASRAPLRLIRAMESIISGYPT